MSNNSLIKRITVIINNITKAIIKTNESNVSKNKEAIMKKNIEAKVIPGIVPAFFQLTNFWPLKKLLLSNKTIIITSKIPEATVTIVINIFSISVYDSTMYLLKNCKILMKIPNISD